MAHSRFVRSVAAFFVLAVPALAQSPAWQPRTVTAPPARNSSPAAYDVYRGATVLFGGYDGTTTPRRDT